MVTNLNRLQRKQIICNGCHKWLHKLITLPTVASIRHMQLQTAMTAKTYIFFMIAKIAMVPIKKTLKAANMDILATTWLDIL